MPKLVPTVAFCSLALAAMLMVGSCTKSSQEKQKESGEIVSDQRYSLTLDLPYDVANRRIVGISDGIIVGNLVRKLYEEHDVLVQAERLTIQDQTADALQGLFKIDQNGDIRLLDSIALIARVLDEAKSIALLASLQETTDTKPRYIHTTIHINLYYGKTLPIARVQQFETFEDLRNRIYDQLPFQALLTAASAGLKIF